jgi:hypothetical protein
MKILFTLLCIDSSNSMYSDAARRLVHEILDNTSHDILLSTNSSNLLDEFSNNNRIIVRDNISNTDSIIMYGGEFNYNLKYHAFQDIPTEYDILIYLDCDIKFDGWTDYSDKYIENIFTEYDFGATRLNCSMRGSIDEYRQKGRTLFSHKIESYKIIENYHDDDDIMLSLLPSEHFLIFKNDVIKLQKFYEKWRELNSYLQSIEGRGGSWGDGFEIGVSARYAGFHKTIEIGQGTWDGILGFKFNGNKYQQNIKKQNIFTNNRLDIIAVAYNQIESLKCFIQSIKCQTNNNWKLFIIHDGPNTELKNSLQQNNYLEDDKIIFIEHPIRAQNNGHPLRKWGLANLVKNEYVLITNADNYYTPNMVDEVLKNDADFIYFDCVHSHETNINYNKSSYGYMNCQLLPNNIDMGCVAVKSSIATNIGFNSTSYSADWDYFNSILNQAKPSIVKINKILFVHN